MATSLILHKRIKTTTAKAKALRMFVEPLINRSKEDTTHSRRLVFSHLQSKDAVNELFREVATKIAERPGGYTRIIKMGNRMGDNADMCLIELVDYNELMLAGAAPEKVATGKRRRRRGAATPKVQEQAKTKTDAKDTAEKPSVEDVADTQVEAVADTKVEVIIDEASTPDDTTGKTADADAGTDDKKPE